MALFLDADTTVCTGDLLSILGIIRNKVIPMIQIAIIAALVFLLILDLGKAVMAGKEDEIKSAQKLAIKRLVYALVVFLVPLIVNVVLSLISPVSTGTGDYSNIKTASEQKGSAVDCWNLAKNVK